LKGIVGVISNKTARNILDLRNSGLSTYEVARRCGVSRETVRRLWRDGDHRSLHPKPIQRRKVQRKPAKKAPRYPPLNLHRSLKRKRDAKRCPTCGSLGEVPCRVCALRMLLWQNGGRFSGFKFPRTAPIIEIDLTEGSPEKRRYEQLRRWHDAGVPQEEILRRIKKHP
jgi:IS30 family transposase